MSMFGKCCKKCNKQTRHMDYCDKHYDKDRMIGIFKKSCKKHLDQFDAKQHRKKNVISEIFEEMHNIFTTIIKPR